MRDTFPCLSIDYKGEDAANNDGPLDKNLVSTGFRAEVGSVGSVRELTERKVSPGAFARLNDAGSEPRTREREKERERGRERDG